MVNKNNLKEVLIYLSKAGVSFYGGHVQGGLIDLDIEQVINYAENRDQFFADLLNVDVETIRQYESFLDENFQCTALTGKRKRCLRRADDAWDVTKFQYGVTTLCVWHKKHLLENPENHT
jgi:hypothetical protein